MQRYGVNLVSTTGLCVPAPSNDLMNSLSVYIKGLDEWGVTGKCSTYTQLPPAPFHTGFHFGLRSCKSLILTCALFEGHTDPLETCELSRLEVRHQVYVTLIAFTCQLYGPTLPYMHVMNNVYLL